MASVSYIGVTKQLGSETVALSRLSLEVRDTEFMILVGPSGCGKSTALRLLAGLEDVSEGQITIGDRVVNGVPPRDRDIAMVFQSYALYPQMSVYDNMAFGLRMRGVARREIERRVSDAAAVLRLGSLLKRKPRELSGGQRQRVALGRAMVREPKVFLLDEPLSNLDAQLRVQTRIELQKQHRALQTTFIYVTHDQVEAMTMADRIAVLKDGVLQQVAPPREIYNSPANLYVAGFMGSPSMNFIPVTISGRTAKASGFEVELARAPGIQRGILGVRPEALTDRVQNGESFLDLRVDVVEVLGSDQYVYGAVAGDTMSARVDPSLRVESGDHIRLQIDVKRVHLFDPISEQSVI